MTAGLATAASRGLGHKVSWGVSHESLLVVGPVALLALRSLESSFWATLGEPLFYKVGPM